MDKLKELWKSAVDWWHALPQKTAALVLDWTLLGAGLILVIVIYVPRGIWAEENIAMNEARRRMEIISKTEDHFRTITGQYSTDGRYLFQMISQTHDTLTGDSTFFGEQRIFMGNDPVMVDIPEGMGWVMDTTYSVGRPIRITVYDTVYSVVLWDAELSAHDTVYMTGVRSLDQFFDDPGYRGIADTSTGTHTEIDADFTWNRYRLTTDLLESPITGEPFALEVDSLGELKIYDSLPRDYYESRYLFFKFAPRNVGRIVGMDATWRGQ